MNRLTSALPDSKQLQYWIRGFCNQLIHFPHLLMFKLRLYCGINWKTKYPPHSFYVSMFKCAFMVSLIFFGHLLISTINEKEESNATALAAKSKLDHAAGEIASLKKNEDSFTSCLNKEVLIADDGTVIDCHGVKTIKFVSPIAKTRKG